MTDDLPVNDIDAEKYTLSAMMWNPQAVAECAEIVGPADFFRPIHQKIFVALVQMFSAQEPVTPVTLLAWMKRDGIKIDPLYLHELYAIPVPGLGVHHARLVWETAVRRNIEETGMHLAQMAGNLSEAPGDLLSEAQRRLTRMLRNTLGEGNDALGVKAFMELESRATQPVIPGLLEHQERVIVVGSEGSGKTTLAFQMGFALAAGTHPFAGSAIPPGRVMIVDLENPIEILRRRVRHLYEYACGFDGWDDTNMSFWCRPGGIDMTSPAQAFKLAEAIRVAQPDLLICGPIYKMLPGGEVGEWMHATVCRFFDVMRSRYDCAVWLETHAPMQTNNNGERAMRPLGSGVYSRWPEFGISLAREAKGALTLKRFRGDREEGRTWPSKLVRSSHGWPWSAVYPPGTFNERGIAS